ncbi:anti-sigma factor [Calycomorphotria hydatis]|uniref:Uncharacterized protein n=1 Tax=Calycomorphotria hydatis TaxID=2528027 RepID=A0A517T5R5_9PLAN|nr:hypothetical protein [Calycomorphotria hydatis]QDT63717.1 hypothetical protein V22_09420 [Calycomorphotria hydatis]
MTGPTTNDRRRIALLVGEDLETEHVSETEQKVKSCPHCKEHWSKLRRSLDALDGVADQRQVSLEDSVWPELSQKIIARKNRALRREERLNAWVPALACAAACMALFSLTSMPGNSPNATQYSAGTFSPASYSIPTTTVDNSLVPAPSSHPFYQDAPGTYFGSPDMTAQPKKQSVTMPNLLDSPSKSVSTDRR